MHRLLFARGRMATGAFTVRKLVSRTLAFSHEPSKAQQESELVQHLVHTSATAQQCYSLLFT